MNGSQRESSQVMMHVMPQYNATRPPTTNNNMMVEPTIRGANAEGTKILCRFGSLRFGRFPNGTKRNIFLTKHPNRTVKTPV
jgi:hypothetical protein